MAIRLDWTTYCVVILTYASYVLVSNRMQEYALGTEGEEGQGHGLERIQAARLSLSLLGQEGLSTRLRPFKDVFRSRKGEEEEQVADRHNGSRSSGMSHRDEMERARVARLLASPVPILLSQDALRSHADFSCGGSQVVRLHGYSSLRPIGNLEKILPAHDPLAGRPYNTCAVVGNSGSLLEGHHGPEIDAHDVVIRFNSGITSGYEQFVGSKTTFRLYNRPQVEPKEAGEATVSTVRDHDVRHWAAAVRGKAGGGGGGGGVRAKGAYALDPEFLCHTWQWVRHSGHKPSSGLVGIVMGLHMCQSVTAYGFQFRNYYSRTSRPHYYDWERPAKGRENVHPFSREVSLYLLLEKLGHIRLVQ